MIALPRISIIAAIGEKNFAIGKKDKLIWKIPDDLKHFRKLTEGHTIIMGRKTFESIGRPLKNRTNIIITRNESYNAPDCIISSSPEEALKTGRGLEKEELFIIGGGEIYKALLPFTSRLYLTLVNSNEKGDIFFPDYTDFKKTISTENHASNEGLKYKFVVLER